jgi:uroporphyrin-III C-methyltransferase/precorrin-2 dehydrogenase/sirohydrochlorin ferrochelatase
MDDLPRLPLFFALAGRRVLLVGGSAAAAWKAELLRAAGAHLVVVAKEIGPELAAVLADVAPERLTTIIRDWSPDDLDGVALAIAAFETDGEAACFAGAARAAGVPVNVVDKPDHCDFAFGSLVNRAPLIVGISTDGIAPVLGQRVRLLIETLLPATLGRWLDRARALRSEVAKLDWPLERRRALWDRFADRALAGGEPDDLAGLTDSAPQGETTRDIVTFAPDDPESLTLRDLRALMRADLVVVPDARTARLLPGLRREARIVTGEPGEAEPGTRIVLVRLPQKQAEPEAR